MRPAQNNIDKGWWWDRTWSPLAMRCEKTSPGCTNCWHLRFVDRMKMNPKFPAEHREAYAGDREPIMTDRLNDPMKWKKPQVIAVQLMGDLFHESVSMEQILSVFSMMNRCQQHTFIVLTKRTERMLEFCEYWGLIPMIPGGPTGSGERWPANVIAMTTVENQEMADKRIPILLRVPAPVLGISVEPMLSPIDVGPYIEQWQCPECKEWNYGSSFCDACDTEQWENLDNTPVRGLNLIICGGETGPGARPMHPDWVRNLRNQCEDTDRASFFFKHWGEWGFGKCTQDLPPESIVPRHYRLWR